MRAAQLRFALLASLGALPLACGGSTSQRERPNANAGENTAGAGAPSDVEVAAMPPTCTAPALDPATGLTACAEGYSHRPEPVSCPGSVCQTDADCATTTPSSGAPFSICSCDGYEGQGQCTPSACTADADCAEGYRCATYNRIWGSPFGPPPALLTCQTALDTCVSDADCRAPEACNSILETDGRRHRACGPATCPSCGRPFLVLGRPRVAPVVKRSDWLVSVPT